MRFGIKGICLAALGVVIGSLAAWGFFRFQVATTKENFFDGQWPPKVETAQQQTKTKLTVEGLNPRDLGQLLTGTKTTVDFILRNPDTKKLKFQLVEPLPPMLETDLSANGAEISAGTTYPVTVTVSPVEADPKFTKSIVVQTEEGTQTILTINAQVNRGLELGSKEVAFSRTLLATESIKDVQLVCATAEKLQVKQILVDGKAELPAWLHVEPLEMDSELLGQNPGFKSGLVLRITISPDLPADLTSARLQLVTDQPQYLPQTVKLVFNQ